jgi:hypothetical protein
MNYFTRLGPLTVKGVSNIHMVVMLHLTSL